MKILKFFKTLLYINVNKNSFINSSLIYCIMIYVARVNELPIAVDESELFDYIVDEIDVKTELTVGQDVTYESIESYVSKFMEDNEGDAFTVDEFNQILSDAATKLSKN